MVHVKQFKFGTFYLVAGSERSATSTAPRSKSSATRCGSRFYVISTLLVGLHLRHGISSAFQSLGLDHPLYTRRLVAWGIGASSSAAGSP